LAAGAGGSHRVAVAGDGGRALAGLAREDRDLPEAGDEGRSTLTGGFSMRDDLPGTTHLHRADGQALIVEARVVRLGEGAEVQGLARREGVLPGAGGEPG